MKLSEAVNKVIELSSKVRAYYEVELPKRHPKYPLVYPEDKSTPPPPEEKELQDFLSTLSMDMLCQLILLMNLGRMHFGVNDLANQFEESLEEFSDLENAVSYLMYQAALAAQLEDGLDELRKHHLDIDKLPLRPVEV